MAQGASLGNGMAGRKAPERGVRLRTWKVRQDRGVSRSRCSSGQRPCCSLGALSGVRNSPGACQPNLGNGLLEGPVSQNRTSWAFAPV